MNLNNAEFIKSAVSSDGFPADHLPQIVFAGRSNVGKSSVINRLLNRKNFARVGEAPGKTVHINFFLIDKKAYFVDIPGYGYAIVSKTEKERWGALLEQYFAFGTVSVGILIVDIRHKPTKDDITMAKWFMNTGVPFIVVANKADKLKPSERQNAADLIRTTLKTTERVRLIPFSSVSGEGRDELLSEIINMR